MLAGFSIYENSTNDWNRVFNYGRALYSTAVESGRVNDDVRFNAIRKKQKEKDIYPNQWYGEEFPHYRV